MSYGDWHQIDPTKGNNFCECESHLLHIWKQCTQRDLEVFFVEMHHRTSINSGWYKGGFLNIYWGTIMCELFLKNSHACMLKLRPT